MKKLIIMALALASFNMQAQDKKEDRMAIKKERLNKMNAEDMAQIQTKKMVLALDLSDAQQKQVEQVELKTAKRRLEHMKKKATMAEKGEKPSEDARLKMQNDKLDNRIATKREMKKILNESQYEKWNTMHERKHKMGRPRKMERKRGTAPSDRDGDRRKH
ncbi:hypothetical protein N7U66_17760 [Lacinutrix neustonica]|uniref:DUF4890 domain-containing protein n=1 Tax=Lacinutrix neustonica TaxID=2980107 RepID=A0A9E8MUE7_9FLAO|nr:hypothetical protein [Lacinutrix neustonica]WAC01723.1 hypothetical protein N7U66_17760 [Lacinutrix neustonica]